MSVAAKMPERIWTELNPYDFPGFSPCWVWHSDDGIIDTSGVQPYIRADLVQAKDAEIARLRAEREAALAGLGPIAELLPDAVAAAEKAMRKFPQPNYVISKWAEETGEVTKDLIHMAEGRQTADKLRGEMVQALAMLHRLLVEGDQVHGLPPVCEAISAMTPPDDPAATIAGLREAAEQCAKPGTEYERKVAQMKEDFPNGI